MIIREVRLLWLWLLLLVVLVTLWKFDVDVSCGVLLGWSLNQARTVMTIFLNADVYLFLCAVFRPLWRKTRRDRRVVTFPSGALFYYSWKLDLRLDVRCLDLGGDGDVAVRRRKDAKGNRYAGVKVQIAGALARESSSRMPFDVRKEDKKGPLASRGKKGEGRKRLE